MFKLDGTSIRVFVLVGDKKNISIFAAEYFMTATLTYALVLAAIYVARKAFLHLQKD